MKVRVPPIKCQGIKTKMVPLIREMAAGWDREGVWIEPFMGSGVVGFNLAPKRALFADTNPHTIAFFKALQSHQITPSIIHEYLESEGRRLALDGEKHYYRIRERFNRDGHSLDFLFLNRSCFNGVMRFNRKGGFNVPFCRKPDRFAQAYITKIVNQSSALAARMRESEWHFCSQSFNVTLKSATSKDFIYADPPYAGRHVDYFDSWDGTKEACLFELLSKTPTKFILSTWEENTYRRNPLIDELWGVYPRVTQDHFYHVGGSEANRNSMTEALVMNFQPPHRNNEDTSVLQPTLTFV
jgi:DNA adenine methylase